MHGAKLCKLNVENIEIPRRYMTFKINEFHQNPTGQDSLFTTACWTALDDVIMSSRDLLGLRCRNKIKMALKADKP
ncbi:hypothetical protein TNIN_291911 [Trichonephila inaurata madagascariensis]|uniref:Uncharacterized protein n=1 Tax=Trichonephila inaurata madagascariensis TaxID=2747483 RepID=A0A8X6X310_9ARAC|nr:hypothetical protein TNIN_291911 [Trichonephila inaurata madagascariensis]